MLAQTTRRLGAVALLLLTLLIAASCGDRPLKTVGPGPTPTCSHGQVAYLCTADLWPPGVHPDDPGALAQCTRMMRYFCGPSKVYAERLTAALLQKLVDENPSALAGWGAQYGCVPPGGGNPAPNAIDVDAVLGAAAQALGGDCGSCVTSATSGGCATPYNACAADETCSGCLSCIQAGGGAASCVCGGAGALLAQCLSNACAVCSQPTGGGVDLGPGWVQQDACTGEVLTGHVGIPDACNGVSGLCGEATDPPCCPGLTCSLSACDEAP